MSAKGGRISDAHRWVLRHRWVAVASLAVSGGLISFSMSSSALASTQIGATFEPDTGYGVGTFLQSVTPANEYRAPSSGVITSWSHQAGGSPLAIKLKVARAGGGNDFTIVGESPLKSPTLNEPNTYTDVRIPVHAGDVIGLYNETTNGLLSRDAVGYGYHSLLDTDPPPSDTNTYDALSLNSQFDVSATLETDCDGDGFGDETQDPDTSACKPPSTNAATGQRAAALMKCKKNYKKNHKKKKFKKCKKKANLLPA